MPATLVDINGAPAMADPPGRERTLREAYWRVFFETRLGDDQQRAITQYPDYLERRVRQLERSLKAVIDSQGPKRRGQILGLLYGPKGAERRDPKLLTAAEMRLFECYRAIDTEGKQMLRQLCTRLARTSSGGDPAQEEGTSA